MDRYVFKLYIASFLCLVLSVPVTIPAETLTDDEGQTISFEHPYSRIISLYPAHTENLVSLQCQDKLIAVGPNDDYPEEILHLPRISYRDNTEKFLAAKPDLLLIRPMISRSQPELIAQLRDTGITIVSLQPTSAEEMFSYWQSLAKLCGKPDNAISMRKSFLREVKTVHALLPPEEERPGVYFESIHHKMKTFAPSAISIYALENGGGRNVATDASGRNNSNIAPYGKERILAKGAQIDVFLSQVGRMNAISKQEIYTEPGFQLIKAVRNNAVCLVDEKIVSRPTMRLLSGIQHIYDCLYPSSPNITSSFGEMGFNQTQPRR